MRSRRSGSKPAGRVPAAIERPERDRALRETLEHEDSRASPRWARSMAPTMRSSAKPAPAPMRTVPGHQPMCNHALARGVRPRSISRLDSCSPGYGTISASSRSSAPVSASFTQAAAQLHVSQPVVSRTPDLERSLGVSLFDRTTRSVRLTPEGSELLAVAADLLDRTENAMERFASYCRATRVDRDRRAAVGRRRVASHHPRDVPRFASRHPVPHPGRHDDRGDTTRAHRQGRLRHRRTATPAPGTRRGRARPGPSRRGVSEKEHHPPNEDGHLAKLWPSSRSSR